MAPARLAARPERVRALALSRGARRAGNHRPAAHRRRGRRRRRRAVRSALALQSGEIAAAAACGIAFFAAAAYDWVWQLAGDRGRRCRECSASPSGLSPRRARLPGERSACFGRLSRSWPWPRSSREYVVLPAGGHLRNSQAAYRAGDGAESTVRGARGQGDRALGGQPVSPARVRRRGRAPLRRGRALGARGDPALETTTGACGPAQPIFETGNGNLAAARRDLAEARRLNPHSTSSAMPKPGGG